RAAAAAPGIDLRLDHPAPQRRLGQVELTRHRADALATLPHHPDRFRLELRRERSPPPLLPHDSLLSHFSCGSECLRNPGKPKPLERPGPKLEALPRCLRSITLNEVLVCVRGMELDDLARAPVVTAECPGHE